MVTIATSILVLTMSGWFGYRVLGLRGSSGGRLVLHYSVEWGIDAIQPWYWALVFPATWLIVTVVDLLWAFGVYREDRYQSWVFFSFALGWSIPWVMVLWHLIRINS